LRRSLPPGRQCCPAVGDCSAEVQAACHWPGAWDWLLPAEVLEPDSLPRVLLVHEGQQHLACRWQQQLVSGCWCIQKAKKWQEEEEEVQSGGTSEQEAAQLGD